MKVVTIAVVALLAVGCAKKDLDRETAMRLVKGRIVQTINGSFLTLGGLSDMPNLSGAFRQLINAGVLRCDQFNCDVVPGAPGFTGALGEASFTAGNLVPAAITGITTTSPNSAAAEVQLTFEPSPVYVRFRGALDTLTSGGAQAFGGGGPVQPRINRRSAQAQFQRFDDGWRLVAIQ